jgi:hypothetical protein
MANAPLIYVECEIPPGQTLDAWRRERAGARRRRRWRLATMFRRTRP